MKKQLATADAQELENAFANKLLGVNAELFSEARDEVDGVNDAPLTTRTDSAAADRKQRGGSAKANGDRPVERCVPDPAPSSCSPAKPQRQTAAVMATRPRLRDKEHLKFVRTQPCLVCGRSPSDSHHLRFAQQRALGRKVSDEFTVPLCRLHHRELHRHSDEARWWQAVGVDAIAAARKLWTQSHTPLSPADDGAHAAPPEGASDETGKRRVAPPAKRTQFGMRHDVPQAT